MKTKLLASLTALMLSLAGPMASEVAPSRIGLKPGEAKAKMEAAALEIATLRSNIVQTLVQLDHVRNPQNRQANFQEFRRNLTSLENQVQRTTERAQAMKRNTSAYFAEWEARTAEIQDPAKRRNAESRYTARKRSYDNIVTELQEARRNFDPMLSSLKQIQIILENNPDPGQIAAAKDLFMRANWRCLDVQRSLMATEAEFTFLAADFAQNET